MSYTRKATGWLAGRLFGEKARKSTMNWMQKTGVGKALSLGGDYLLAQGAIKGVTKGVTKGAGALKNLVTGGGSAGAGAATVPGSVPPPTVAGDVIETSTGRIVGGPSLNDIANANIVNDPRSWLSRGASTAASAAQSALNFAKENPVPVAQALQAGLGMYQTAQEAELERQMREEEQERRRRLARLLVPALQAQAAPPTGR